MIPERNPYCIDPESALRFNQMPGLETAILTVHNGESMMMVFGSMLPGHSAPMQTHRHEQIVVVYSGKAE